VSLNPSGSFADPDRSGRLVPVVFNQDAKRLTLADVEDRSFASRSALLQRLLFLRFAF
jgi:hypothetical protein